MWYVNSPLNLNLLFFVIFSAKSVFPAGWAVNLLIQQRSWCESRESRKFNLDVKVIFQFQEILLSHRYFLEMILLSSRRSGGESSDTRSMIRQSSRSKSGQSSKSKAGEKSKKMEAHIQQLQVPTSYNSINLTYTPTLYKRGNDSRQIGPQTVGPNCPLFQGTQLGPEADYLGHNLPKTCAKKN